MNIVKGEIFYRHLFNISWTGRQKYLWGLISSHLQGWCRRKSRHSYDSKDYLDIYKKFDLVIGPRVHGIGMSASMGIPGILIAHDMRGDTGKGFMAKIIRDDEPYHNIHDIIRGIVKNIESYNKELINHKNVIGQKYIRILRQI